MSTRIIWLLGVLTACGSVGHDVPADAKTGAPDDATAVPLDGPPCPQVIDQAVALCASPPIAQCTNAFVTYSGGTAAMSGQIYAQVFTPKATGSINHVRLHGSNPVPSSNPIEVTIVDLQNNPVAYIDSHFVVADHVLARATTPMTSVDDWHDVSFTTAAHVVAGLPYALNVRQIGDTNPGQDNYMRWSMFNDYTAMVDTYPRGQLFFCQTGTCTAQPSYQDAEFEVYVSPSTCN